MRPDVGEIGTAAVHLRFDVVRAHGCPLRTASKINLGRRLPRVPCLDHSSSSDCVDTARVAQLPNDTGSGFQFSVSQSQDVAGFPYEPSSVQDQLQIGAENSGQQPRARAVDRSDMRMFSCVATKGRP